MRQLSAVAVLPLLLTAGSIAGSQSRSGTVPSTRTVVDVAAKYVKEYQQQLTSIVADETYEQEIRSQTPHENGMPRSRTMKSEIFFTFSPGAGAWMAIRDVSSVDGKPVDDRRDVREALRTAPASEVSRSFKTYNSRFNLGRVFRDFNEPTFSLLALDPNHRDRFSFDRKRAETSNGGTLVTLAFVERDSPTLIRSLTRGNVFSKGELTIDVDTGRVTRAFVTGKIEHVRMELTTVYSPDERLGMWVPSLFREHYEYGATASTAASRSRDPSAEYEDIVCEARYTNFRRFETTTRIIR